jgi:hypothetical protein
MNGANISADAIDLLPNQATEAGWPTPALTRRRLLQTAGAAVTATAASGLFGPGASSLVGWGQPTLAQTADTWSRFQNTIEGFLHVGPGANLQVPAAMQPLQWDDPNFGLFYAWLGFANLKPDWSDTYEPLVGSAADEAYRNFLWSLAVPLTDPSLQEKANQVTQRIADVAQKETDYYNQMVSDWAKFNAIQQQLPPEFQKTFSQWYNENYASVFINLNQERDNLGVEYQHYAGKAGAGWQDVNTARQDEDRGRDDDLFPAYRMKILDPTGLTDLSQISDVTKVPTRRAHTYTFSPDLASFVKDAQSGGGTSLDMSMNQSTSNFHKSEWEGGGHAGISFGFFSFGGSGGYEHTDVDSNSSAFSMKFSAPAFVGIQILPGPWFHREVVQNHKDGPFLPASPVGTGSVHLFGPGGIFSLMNSMAYVAYKPEITMTLAESDYHRLETSWKASSSFGIGPFSFGGGASSNNTDVTFNVDGKSITVKSSSSDPQLFAVRTDRLP